MLNEANRSADINSTKEPDVEPENDRAPANFDDGRENPVKTMNRRKSCQLQQSKEKLNPKIWPVKYPKNAILKIEGKFRAHNRAPFPFLGTCRNHRDAAFRQRRTPTLPCALPGISAKSPPSAA